MGAGGVSDGVRGWCLVGCLPWSVETEVEIYIHYRVDMCRTRVFGVIVGCSDGRGYRYGQ